MHASAIASKGRGIKHYGFINVHSDNEVDQLRSSQTPLMLPSTSTTNCIVCKGTCSTIAKCKQYEELSLDAKWNVVKDAKLCRKCLRKHNGSCRQQKSCGVDGCTFLHHPLLHNRSQGTGNRSSSAETPTSSMASCNVHQMQTSEVLFRIVPVLVHGPKQVVKTYAFIDDGSELTLMEDSLAEKIDVKGPRTLCLKWTGGTKRVEADSQIINVGISTIEDVENPYLQDEQCPYDPKPTASTANVSVLGIARTIPTLQRITCRILYQCWPSNTDRPR